MRVFEPRMEILPLVQRKLWPSLRGVAGLGFTLYGGTAIALRLGHRESVDFDFFSEKELDREAISAMLPFMAKATTLQSERNTWVVLTEQVKLSFFGAITFGRVGEPERTSDGVLLVASTKDLMATKLKVMLQRAEAKDYRDVAAMLANGEGLSEALAAARLLFGPNFQPSESLKALTYFDDGDLRALTEQERKTLVTAVTQVRPLPAVSLRSLSLGAAV